MWQGVIVFGLCGRAGKEREDPFLFRWVIRKNDGFAYDLVKRKKVFAYFFCRKMQEGLYILAFL